MKDHPMDCRSEGCFNNVHIIGVNSQIAMRRYSFKRYVTLMSWEFVCTVHFMFYFVPYISFNFFKFYNGN